MQQPWQQQQQQHTYPGNVQDNAAVQQLTMQQCPFDNCSQPTYCGVASLLLLRQCCHPIAAAMMLPGLHVVLLFACLPLLPHITTHTHSTCFPLT